MAMQHLDPTDDPTAGPVPSDILARYLRDRATEFLRALRRHREAGPGGPPARTEARPGGSGPEESVDAARALRRSARRISGSLHTFRPLLQEAWSEEMRPELAWLSGALGREHAYQARLERLLLALHRLSGSAALPVQGLDPAEVAAAGPPSHPAAPDRGNLTVGAAKAGALLERQLTLARTRAHSTALQALGSARFHAVADQVAVLASEVPLTPAAAAADLRPLAAAAQDRLHDAVAALPLVTAGSPYNATALIHGLSPDPSPHPQDAPWHQVRLLLRLHRYAREVVLGGGAPTDVRIAAAGRALDHHRDAAEAAAAAASAARTPRIAPATAYALGVLHADQRHEVEAARFAFQQAWQMQTVSAP
ncbi:CHAD domain-containing protein [Streptomyces tropicalis]|uniref:CHAD domain-containing protein n=1 Tax=Streptomyces tropicalis TaxID=3034234 RepID=A0ABT6A6Q9_9ACTN|nr:CHAD domain-containing protein [Streptomyces tropicalis]MDF3300324.1 CHAD domain-containing protein [Streptomyces tropicalis]